MLLVLDNFEHLVAGASVVTELLATAASLKILVTSRAALHLYGEQEFPVPPLALPNSRALPPVDALSQYSAIALFSFDNILWHNPTLECAAIVACGWILVQEGSSKRRVRHVLTPNRRLGFR